LHPRAAGKVSPAATSVQKEETARANLSANGGAIHCDDIQLHNADANRVVPAVAKPFLKGVPALQHIFVNSTNYEEYSSVYV